jgi:DNA-binding Lrp family transcriptional regulator
MKAIVLINIETGEIQYAFRDLKRISGIKLAHLTFGPYDAIAILESENLNKIGRTVEFEIQTIPGVLHTCTCLLVEGEIPEKSEIETEHRIVEEPISTAAQVFPIAA